MSDKELAVDLVKRLPDSSTLRDIARELEFIAGVREGFSELDRGEGVSLDEVAKQLPQWITK
jgi:predicted transcriptional regulator